MEPRVNALQASAKTAAVAGIAFFWVNFTATSLKMGWHIISTSPEDETLKLVVKQRVMCEECHGYFLDDGGELIDGKFCVNIAAMVFFLMNLN